MSQRAHRDYRSRPRQRVNGATHAPRAGEVHRARYEGWCAFCRAATPADKLWLVWTGSAFRSVCDTCLPADHPGRPAATPADPEPV